jgi:hypothetical protein
LSILDWLENHQVVAASLINVCVVLIVAISTNQWQFRRETQRWQREKLYELYQETQKYFSDLLKSCGSSKYSYIEDFYRVITAISNLTLVCPNEYLQELESIKSDLTNLVLSGSFDSSSSRCPKVSDVALLIKRLSDVVKSDARLKDLFK